MMPRRSTTNTDGIEQHPGRQLEPPSSHVAAPSPRDLNLDQKSSSDARAGEATAMSTEKASKAGTRQPANTQTAKPANDQAGGSAERQRAKEKRKESNSGETSRKVARPQQTRRLSDAGSSAAAAEPSTQLHHEPKRKQAVVFGTNLLERGAIAPILYRAGYDIAFVDLNNAARINSLLQTGSYTVTTHERDSTTSLTIDNYRIVSGAQPTCVSCSILTADLVVVALDPSFYRTIALPLGLGIMLRPQSELTVVVYSSYHDRLAGLLRGMISETGPVDLRNVTFADSFVDRMFRTSPEDPGLDIDCEGFCEWNIETSTFTRHPPPLPQATFIPDIHTRLRNQIHLREASLLAAGLIALKHGYQHVHEVMQIGIQWQMGGEELNLIAGIVPEVMVRVSSSFQDENDVLAIHHLQIIFARLRNPSLQMPASEAARHALYKVREIGMLLDPLMRLATLNEECNLLLATVHLSLDLADEFNYSDRARALGYLSGPDSYNVALEFLGRRALQTSVLTNFHALITHTRRRLEQANL
jgi:mannitol-1-phosphate 5-dehydrogenase